MRCGYHLSVLGRVQSLDGRFLLGYCLLMSSRLERSVQALSERQTHVCLRQYSRRTCLPSAVPPLETQQRIARFLDEKTAQIDGLIEKKRALLDRLAEKRQALITRAVTKGLNPDAPMKPSGIDWLGDIPAHWEVLRLKSYRNGLKTGHTPGATVDAYWDRLRRYPWSRSRTSAILRDGRLYLRNHR